MFSKELPDADNSKIATVIEHFEIAGKETMLIAKKVKDGSGTRWTVDYVKEAPFCSMLNFIWVEL